ncbi:hypothetical protein EDC04DRAFT_2869825 [Pisolithus marmoratus]|nr:hypothetical protein EDC04DRAFT_2869825 [Pisolithus marmoratus]
MASFPLSSAPLGQIEPHIRWLWKAQLTDQQIIAELHKHIDTNEYGIGLTKFKAIQKQLRLYCTCQQKLTPGDIQEVMVEMQNMYPDAGLHEMIGLLFHEHSLAVLRSIMHLYFLTYEADLLNKCKVNRLQCCQFWAARVNDIWTIDQHNKWLWFGLGLYTGIEPFSGCILWIKAWHSNQNPQLILSYYLEAVENLGHNDPGTEIFGITNAQTLLWQIHNLTLEGFKNIMPEIAWSQLQRCFSPGFEALLDLGVDTGWYDPDNTLQLMVFHWLFIPWLQVELNNYCDHINNSHKCPNRKKILPQGIPELICTCAEDYGALDFRVTTFILQQYKC